MNWAKTDAYLPVGLHLNAQGVLYSDDVLPGFQVKLADVVGDA